MARKWQLEVEVPHGLQAGDKFVIEVENPNNLKVAKSSLACVSLKQMTLDQLKQERINARSVYGKAKRRGVEEIELRRAKQRVDAVAQEIASRTGRPVVEEIQAPEGLFINEDVS